MTFNLKNRPDTGDALAKAVFDEWFEGFEKRERKRLEDAEKKLNVSADVLPFKSYERGFLAGYVKAKKEILGDA